MCDPVSITIGVVGAASMAMGMLASEKQADYQEDLMDYNNKVNEQNRQLNQADITAQAQRDIGTARSSNTFMSGMAAPSDQAINDITSQAGRDLYMNNLRAELSAGVNNASATNARVNANNQSIGEMFKFGKSMAMMGAGSIGEFGSGSNVAQDSATGVTVAQNKAAGTTGIETLGLR